MGLGPGLGAPGQPWLLPKAAGWPWPAWAPAGEAAQGCCSLRSPACPLWKSAGFLPHLASERACTASVALAAMEG